MNQLGSRNDQKCLEFSFWIDMKHTCFVRKNPEPTSLLLGMKRHLPPMLPRPSPAFLFGFLCQGRGGWELETTKRSLDHWITANGFPCLSPLEPDLAHLLGLMMWIRLIDLWHMVTLVFQGDLQWLATEKVSCKDGQESRIQF